MVQVVQGPVHRTSSGFRPAGQAGGGVLEPLFLIRAGVTGEAGPVVPTSLSRRGQRSLRGGIRPGWWWALGGWLVCLAWA